MGTRTMQLEPGCALRCAVYARISPKPEGAVGDNYSIAAQLFKMKAVARRDFGCAKPDEYVDKDYSGKDLDRPGLERLRRAGPANVRRDHRLLSRPSLAQHGRLDDPASGNRQVRREAGFCQRLV